MLTVVNDLRSWLLRGLVAVAAAGALLVVAAILWGLLSLLGDETGAQVARGTTLAAAIATVVGLSTLVLLLACDRLANADTPPPRSEQQATPPLTSHPDTKHPASDF